MSKRMESRRAVRLPVELIAPWQEMPVQTSTIDLSPRGAFVESRVAPAVGDDLLCCFEIPTQDADQVCFLCRVRRVAASSKHLDADFVPGFGVEFLNISPMMRLRIRQALDEMPRTQADDMRMI